jgi:ribosome maturation factor RimP
MSEHRLFRQKTTEEHLSKKIESIAQEIGQPIIEGAGFEFVDVEFVKQGTQRHLIYYIDKPGGILIEDCEKASRMIDAELDRLDPIEEAYILCVSSPGLDRPLKKPRDFEKNLGKKVDIKLYKPQQGKKEFTGILQEYADNQIEILAEKDSIRFELKDIALVRLHIDF